MGTPKVFGTILRNRAKCLLCGEIVESTSTHDYRRCRCGALAVDGGHDYIRRSYQEECCFEELSEVYEEVNYNGNIR